MGDWTSNRPPFFELITLIKMIRFLLILTLSCASCISAQTAAPPLTLAQVKQATAEAAIQKNPKNAESYNELALAFVQRALETSDPKYYTDAEQALANSLRLAPDNFGGLKVRVQILLGRCEYVKALALAKTLNLRVRDDVPVYLLVADADIKLGDYKEAEDRAQWALNLRPPSQFSLLPAAQLRELFGDIDGSLAFLRDALQMTSSRDAQERAHILVEMARLSLATGNVDTADKLLNQALQSFPDYHPALAGLARVRSAQQRYPEAVESWRRECQAIPELQNYYGLAETLDRAGRHEEATAAYADFEQKARSHISSADNDNRELVFYYADHARKPAEALRVAHQEISRRHDVYTLDAYAWALYANGQYPEARKQMDTALAVGIRDAEILYHAGAIRSELHEPAAALGYWQQAVALNPGFEPARKALTQAASVAQLPSK